MYGQKIQMEYVHYFVYTIMDIDNNIGYLEYS